VAEEKRREPGRSTDGPVQDPVYEPIGPGWNHGAGERGDDREWASRPGVLRAALRAAAGDWLLSVRSVRFWLAAAAVPLVTSAGAWVLLAAVLVPQTDPSLAVGRYWAYLLAAAFIPAASSFLAMHWGMTGSGRVSPFQASAAPDPDPWAAFFGVMARGAVVAALTLVILLVQALYAGVSGAMAAASAGVVALEFAVFGAIGAGASALFRRQLWVAVAAWGVAGALVVGNVVAVLALLPAVRADEPVSAAFNVARGPGGNLEAYECSPLLSGTAEVSHTERIMWMVAPNPVVMFLMFADDSGGIDEGPGWMRGALQEAADGLQVPCVNAEPRAKDAARMPLEVLGLGIQAGLAGAFLAGGQLAGRRRPGQPALPGQPGRTGQPGQSAGPGDSFG
jgi:hypothetical protein